MSRDTDDGSTSLHFSLSWEDQRNAARSGNMVGLDCAGGGITDIATIGTEMFIPARADASLPWPVFG
jgi:hypothetical protein